VLITDGIESVDAERRLDACRALITHNVVLDVIVISDCGNTELFPLVRLSNGQIFRVSSLDAGLAIVNQEEFVDARLQPTFQSDSPISELNEELLSIFVDDKKGQVFNVKPTFFWPFRQSDPFVQELPEIPGERMERLRDELESCRRAEFHVYPIEKKEEWAWRAFVFGGSKVWWDFVIVFQEDYPKSQPFLRTFTVPEKGTSQAGGLDVNVFEGYHENVRIVDVLRDVERIVSGWQISKSAGEDVRYLEELRFVKVLCPRNSVLEFSGKHRLEWTT
jgi:hypothetical protein